MTAIAGIYHRTGQPADSQTVAPMMHALREYGRDGSRVWSESSIVLGQHSLHVTPQSLHEVLPLHHTESQCCIVADVRLDNRDDLCAMLSVNASDRADIPDSELILRAYDKWGVDCPDHLLGDFAFAIWDDRNQKLFCARDIMGVRPFFYHQDDRQFTFASYILGVRAAGVSDQLDLELLSASLRATSNYSHGERTLFAGIRKLKRAHSMVVTADGIKTWAYWDPDNLPDMTMESDQAYAERLADLMKQSVQARIRSAFPVGAHLSGGLDSSAITVLAARRLKEQGKQLTGYAWADEPKEPLPRLADKPLGPREEIDDERRLIELISEIEGVPVSYSSVTEPDMLANRFIVPGTNDDAEFVHEIATRRQATADGVRVMLSGWGGDELITFNGRGYLADLLRRGQWVKLYRELSAWGSLRDRPIWKPLITKAMYPLIPDRLLERFSSSLLPRGWDQQPLPGMFQPEFAARLAAATPLPHNRARPGVGGRNLQRLLLAREHIPRRIEGWACAGGRVGMTYAYPMLDRRIVEMALTIPEEQSWKNGWNRYVFRNAMNGILPDEVNWNLTKVEPALCSYRQETARKTRRVVGHFLTGFMREPRNYQYLDGDRLLNQFRKIEEGQLKRHEPYGGALFVELLMNQKLVTEIHKRIQNRRAEVEPAEADMAELRKSA
jgi:asparagine synthase (glutamine-hydrolysing)